MPPVVLGPETAQRRTLLAHPEDAHIVQFYADDAALQAAVSEFLLAGLVDGDSLVVIATPDHREAIATAVRARAASFDHALATGRLTLLDARAMLDSFLVDGMPDPVRFEAVVGGLLEQIQARHREVPMRAYGEMVDLLWREGNARGAVRLEELWNDLARRRTFSLLCAYVMGNFYSEEASDSLRAICNAHTHVLPAGDLATDAASLMEHTRALEQEIRERKQLESALRDALEARSLAQEQLASLYRITKTLHADLDRAKVVQRLTDEATALCRAEFGAFFYNVTDAGGESFMLYTLTGVPRERFSCFPMPRNTQLFGPTFRGEGVVRIDDVTKDPRFGNNPPYHGMPAGHLPVASYLAMPVTSRTGEVLGGLFFGHSKPAVFTARDEELLVTVAAHAATAIENARLYEEQKRARAAAELAQRRTEQLHVMTEQLSRALGADAAAAIVIGATRALIGADASAVLLLDPGGTHVEHLYRSSRGGESHEPPFEHDVSTLELAAELPICEAARTGVPVWAVGEAVIDARYPRLTADRQATGAKTYGAVPILFEGRIRGAIAVRCAEERPLDADARVFLLAAARQCGQAIERARLHEATLAARADAEHASRAKDEFLAMLGHELRNPLSPILTAIQLMKLRGDPTSAKEHSIIERQVSHLIHLVDDLLDISRITRGVVQLDKKPIKLGALISRAVEIASPLLEERRHRLELSVPREDIWLEADELRLCQAVTNLLTNAAKYTPPSGTIQVRVGRDGDAVTIRVRDNGIGMAGDLVPHIFDLFVQGARTSDRKQGGLGIGLAIVRNLVAMHGGEVSAASDGPGHGSEVTIRLPAIRMGTAEAPRAAGEGSLRDRVRVTSRRILVVDDNEDAASLLGEMLEHVGHEVHVANDGPHALEALARFEPEIAILDIGLPEMDGYELAAALRERLGPSLRMMALTGYGQEQDRVRAERAGFDAHFVKPVALGKLLGAIELPRS